MMVSRLESFKRHSAFLHVMAYWVLVFVKNWWMPLYKLSVDSIHLSPCSLLYTTIKSHRAVTSYKIGTQLCQVYGVSTNIIFEIFMLHTHESR